MYVSKTSVNLATNASPINSNLSLCQSRDGEILSDSLAVIHESYVNIVPMNSLSRRSKYLPIFKGEDRGKGTVKQVKWVELMDKIFFIVLSTNGLQIYNNEVNDVVYYHGCRETGDEKSYSIGVCVLKHNYLCVGTHLGTVWIFQPNSDYTDFKVVNRVYAHDEAVTLLEGTGTFMVSSSDFVTYLWSFNDKDFDIIRKLKVRGMYTVPTALSFKFGLIIIGYSSGEFCIFDLSDEDFCLRNVAHMLSITGLDFSAAFLILTISNDCFIKIWKYEQVNRKVVSVQAIYNEDGPLYGVGFMNFSSTEFCAVTGNDNKVKIFIDWESKIEIKVDE